MADWTDILGELQKTRWDFDGIRQKYIQALSAYTNRNTIAYYSGWLQKPGVPNLGINDLDKNAFMAAIRGLDRSRGLDLVLHTPGGDVAATESIIDYLLTMFDDIRVIVPQLAMSGGTMIACSSDKILMGRHSSLGPIDPQFNTAFGNMAAHAILEEFKQAHKEIKSDQSRVFVWQPIISKYSPTLVIECQNAIQWSEQIAKKNLGLRMFANIPNAAQKSKAINKVLKELGDHSISLSHGRHLSLKKCQEIGLKVDELERDQSLQDLVLAVHHSMMHTLTSTLASKIVENNNGAAVIQQVAAPKN